MRIGRVIGRVTLSSWLPDLPPGRFLFVQPERAEALLDQAPADSDPVVAYDELSAGLGDRVSISEGREASAPFHPRNVPTDAYVAAILDHVEFTPAADSEGSA